MRLSPRFLFSLSTGGMLLALPVPYVAFQGETAPASPAPMSQPAQPVAEPQKEAQPKQEPQQDAKPEDKPKQEPVKIEAPAPQPAQPAPSQEPKAKPEMQAPAARPALPKSPVTAASPVNPTPESTDEELAFVRMVNEERSRRGLSQLRVDPLLVHVARLHSAEMRDKSYFNHESPTATLKTPLDRYLKACSSRPSYACVGENLFWATVVDVKRGHKAFMESPTHRENVLFPRYEKIGVGIVKDGKGEFWVTQMYLSTTDPVSIAKNRMR